MKSVIMAVILAIVGSGSGTADVVNGNFESGTPNDGAGTHWTRLSPGDPSLTGWTVTRGNVDWFSAQAAQPCAGSRSLELNGNTDGKVSQSFATTPGAAYRVTFCMAGNPNGPPAVKTLSVAATGNPYAEYAFDTTGRTLTDMGWSTRTYSFTATGPSTAIQFDSHTTRDDAGLNAYGPVIDNVIVAEDRATRTMTDQWWNAGESGWGMSVFQQWDTIFACFFVYGADNKPTWFVAVGAYQSGAPTGHVVFAGKLYATTGPYFGGPFDPALVAEREAGTFTFDSDGIDSAAMTYTIDGTAVRKDVSRQTWADENLAGSYYGGFAWDQSCGPEGEQRDHMEMLGAMQITHGADKAVRLDLQITAMIENGASQTVPPNPVATLTGSYSQSGHLGRIPATLTFSVGEEVGTMQWNLVEIERTVNGIVGRFSGDSPYADACHYDGRFGGVRR